MSFPPPIEPRLATLPLTDAALDWKAFERFCLDVLNALPEVRHADFYGAPGDPQDGVDLLAHLVNGSRRTAQCKKVGTFAPADARQAIDENTYEGASEHFLFVSCRTTVRTQKVVDEAGWRLLDLEGISALVRTQLDREAARRIVEDHFSSAISRAFLGPDGPTTFVEPTRYFAPFERGGLFRHDWALVGRDDVIEQLSEAVETRRVVVVPGRGGIGKTRVLRALVDRLAGARVLFALDDVALSPEAAADLPRAPLVVAVDDVHRREDLAPLLAELVRRDDATLLLATRPQRLEALRGEVARAGYRGEEVHVTEPLAELAVAAMEDLAREALGDEHAHHATALAAATADCPLVTVVGGQLLARRAIDPRLLEREEEFRDVVLSRWQQELLGELGSGVDRALAAGALRIVAALAPLSVVDEPTLSKVADELGCDVPSLRSVLGELEAAGLLIARGRLRRIVPDVLADHVLHRACLDSQGRPTGYADALVARYGPTSLTKLLRNLAELDWRIGLTAGAGTVLDEVWQQLTGEFAAADAAGRAALLAAIRPAAVYAPERVLEIVGIGLRDPAAPAPAFGADDATVRAAIPELAARAGRHPELARGVIGLLWELGRDEPGPLHPNPSHPIRLAQELVQDSRSIDHCEALLSVAEQLLAEDAGAGHAWSPLELLRPLVAREVDVWRSEGFGMQLGSAYVIEEVLGPLRRRVFDLIAQEARSGDARAQHVAADLLREALELPGRLGGGAPPEHIEQWHDEQLALVRLVAALLADGPPLLRSELRQTLSWYEDSTLWPDVTAAVREALNAPVRDDERLLTVLARPYDLADNHEDSMAAVAEHGETLATDAASDADLIERLDGALATLDATGAVTAQAWPIIVTLVRTNPERGLALVRWAREHASRPLARFAGTALAVLREQAHPDLPAALTRLDTDDAALRRQLAEYLASGSWHDDPQPEEIAWLRQLVGDEDATIRSVIIGALPVLAQQHASLAVELALDADATSEHSARLVDHVLRSAADSLTDDQIEARLAQLVEASELSWASWELLMRLGTTRPRRVLEVLIERARTPRGGKRAVPYVRSEGDALAGFDDDEYREALRDVVQASHDSERALVRRQLGYVFWALDRSEALWLDVLEASLVDSDEERVKAAAALLPPLAFSRAHARGNVEPGWQMLLRRADFVQRVLEGSDRNGRQHVTPVRSALADVMIGGMSGRGMGQADERHVRTRDAARALAAALPTASITRDFWEATARWAEARIEEDDLEDEEYGEELG